MSTINTRKYPQFDDALKLLNAELKRLNAANWSMGHDPSEGYRQSVKAFLKEFGYERVAERI